jgi:hypothetical protein
MNRKINKQTRISGFVCVLLCGKQSCIACRKTQEDLEVVWQAATSEDLHMKEKLKQVSFLPE